MCEAACEVRCPNLARFANRGAECGFSLMAAVKCSRASSKLPAEEGERKRGEERGTGASG